MVVKTGGGLVKVSISLPERHVEQIRSIAALRSSDWQRVSVSDVSREVVEVGLREILRAAHTDNTATDDDAEQRIA